MYSKIFPTSKILKITYESKNVIHSFLDESIFWTRIKQIYIYIIQRTLVQTVNKIASCYLIFPEQEFQFQNIRRKCRIRHRDRIETEIRP